MTKTIYSTPKYDRNGNYQYESRVTVGDVAVGVLGVAGLTAALIAAHGNEKEKPRQNRAPAPIEEIGVHQSGVDSTSHLNEFAREHGVQLNQK